MTGVAAYARTAYAQGWAASGGPMTDRVKAGCVAAVEWACAHPDEPGILEATLKLGALEGTWALIYQRRDALVARYTHLVQQAWNACIAEVDIGRAIRSIRLALSLGEAREWLRKAVQTIRDAFTSLLSWLPGTSAWQALRTVLGDGITSAIAEGKVGALALAASKEVVKLDFEVAFEHAYDALSNLSQVWSQADGWLGRMLDRNTEELGRTLGDLAERGASYSEMLSAAEDVLTGVTGDAVGFIVDWALNAGLSQGALDLYKSEGITQITFMTAGDDLVCPICEKAESESPYTPEALPTPPLHPRCRCTIVAELSLPGSLEQYLASDLP